MEKEQTNLTKKNQQNFPLHFVPSDSDSDHCRRKGRKVSQVYLKIFCSGAQIQFLHLKTWVEKLR